MDAKALQRLDLFAENTYGAKDGFFWQDSSIRRLAALLYAAQDRAMDVTAIRQCMDLIKRSAGIFSYFRGNFALVMATQLSLCADPETVLHRTLQVYDAMKQTGFRSSDYLVIASHQIASAAPADATDTVVRRAKAFYTGMRSDHFLLTGQDDYIFAAMLGLSDIDVSSGVERLEREYQALRPEFIFTSGSGIQALAQVLVLGGESPDAHRRVMALRQHLRQAGLRLDRSDTLSSLGVLALLPTAVDVLAAEVEETAGTLRAKKGFSGWSVQKEELLLHSAALVAYHYVDQARRGVLQSALSTSIANILIAQQSAVAASTAASAATPG